MFFICGINQEQKDLGSFGPYICGACGSYGRYQIYITYMCLSLFFIPIFKWSKKYYVPVSYTHLGRRKIGETLGWIPVLGAFAMAIGYTVVMGWILKYMVGTFTGATLAAGDIDGFAANFGSMASAWGNNCLLYTSSSSEPVFWHRSSSQLRPAAELSLRESAPPGVCFQLFSQCWP